MAELRELILEAVAPHRDAPLLLSGGVDSATLLAALLSLGARPVCYTFAFGPSDSEDVLVAKSMCSRLGLKQKVVRISSVLVDMERDVREIVRLIGRRPLKTHVQCGIPFMHLARAVAADGFSCAVSGITADDVLGTSKNALVARSKGGEKAYAEHRRKDAENLNNSFYSCERIASACGVKIFAPYKTQPLKSALLGMAYSELHVPRKKACLVRAFPEFWARGKWYRQNKNLQVVSGIRDRHDAFLASPLNRGGHRAVVGVYRDIYDGRV